MKIKAKKYVKHQYTNVANEKIIIKKKKTLREIIFFDLLRKIFHKLSDYHEIHSID